MLDVGCATGYSSAVLAKLAGERRRAGGGCRAWRAARSETLAQIGAHNVSVVSGPLAAGWPEGAPYDVILLEGASEVVPDSLLAQLKDGGRLVAVDRQRTHGQGDDLSQGRRARDRAAAVRRRGAAAAGLRQSRRPSCSSARFVTAPRRARRIVSATVAPMRHSPAFIPMRPGEGFQRRRPPAYDSNRGGGSRRPQLALLRRVDGVKWSGPACGGRSARLLLRPCSACRVRRGAETLESALAQAYRNNPTLNAQRAALRATDEGVPQALAGYRPRVNGTFDSGYQHFESTRSPAAPSPRPTPISARAAATSGWCRRVYNGQRTGNLTRQAEAAVLAGRETLRNAEQTALLDAATAYMNVLRDTAILDLQRRNVQVLQEQLKQTRDRFNVGEVTRTDVAQSESRLAASQSQVLAAEANLKSSQATYRRVIGVEPVNLRAGMPVDRLLAAHARRRRSTQGRSQHPTVDGRAIHRRCRAICREGRRGLALSDRHAGERRAEALGPRAGQSSTS